MMLVLFKLACVTTTDQTPFKQESWLSSMTDFNKQINQIYIKSLLNLKLNMKYFEQY